MDFVKIFFQEAEFHGMGILYVTTRYILKLCLPFTTVCGVSCG